MPSGTLQANINSLFINLPNLYSIYSTQSSSAASYMNDSTVLDKEIQGIHLQIQELDRQEQTYDREFMDRKKEPAKTGIFSRIGLRTTEDFVMTYFFFSYLMFFLMVLINVLVYSTKKVFAVGMVIGVGMLFGFLSILLIYRYA
jgi:hypothetical protein